MLGISRTSQTLFWKTVKALEFYVSFGKQKVFQSGSVNAHKSEAWRSKRLSEVQSSQTKKFRLSFEAWFHKTSYYALDIQYQNIDIKDIQKVLLVVHVSETIGITESTLLDVRELLRTPPFLCNNIWTHFLFYMRCEERVRNHGVFTHTFGKLCDHFYGTSSAILHTGTNSKQLHSTTLKFYRHLDAFSNM